MCNTFLYFHVAANLTFIWLATGKFLIWGIVDLTLYNSASVTESWGNRPITE